MPLSVDQFLFVHSHIYDLLSEKELLACKKDRARLSSYLRKKLDPQLTHLLLGVSGNTPCVELIPDRPGNSHIIFDMGTGFSKVSPRKDANVFHIFLTHFHYDHIQGMPFARWLYDPNNTVHFYSPVKGFKDILVNFMQPPYFPITMEKMTKNLYFHELQPPGANSGMNINGLKFSWMALNHPGGSYAYKIQEGGRSFCYFTDVDIKEDLFDESAEHAAFLSGIDSIVLDASLGIMQSIEQQDWGHSSIFKGLSFCKKWNIKNAYLFHFDPSCDIEETAFDYQIALWYNKAIRSKTNVFFIQEDLRVKV